MAENTEDHEPLRLPETILNDLEVEQAVVKLIQHASELRASDLFFTWSENDVAISVHHLGVLKRIAEVPHDKGRHFINAMKVAAGMHLTERVHPLDGRWVCDLESGKKIDLRINTIPTMYGEAMAIRLLDREVGVFQLEDLGLRPPNYDTLVSMLNSPGGLLLVAGPMGAGKTTTLYAAVHYLNDGTRKIHTIEDPIEYTIEGTCQSQVNLRMDLDFPELLRSVLRQGPAVILIGEIRDRLTAEIAVRAANSGQLVFSSLHAPTAAGTVDTLLALGVHPHFLSTCLLGVVNQRLVHKLCENCKVASEMADASHTFEDVQRWLEPGQGECIYSAPGCEQCYQQGYTQRTGVFEVLHVTREIRQLILQERPPREIHDKAVEQGMIDLARSALLKVAEGVTSREEVMRVIPMADTLFDQ